ncbi:MAG: PQQ-dependent sugar dehydrogenase [Jatrophihabitans sp.]|uniref:PQQ-dependent sugar dehydrogenase n=1 Tax=Jatrophihabitans sp. TaxID=1932789 RepID=UPI0039116EFB
MTLTAATLVGAATASSSAVPSLPAGFQLVTYPTGQAAYNLTNYAWLPDGGLLTSGKDGTVTHVPPGGTPQVIAKVPGVRATGDHGMLGFAPANDYATTGHVYVSYDKGDPATTGFGMVEVWTASPASAPTSFTFTSKIIDGSTTSPQLLESGTTHSIDSVVVAPDDTLFLTIGDNAGNNGDPKTFRAQDLDQPYGKMLHFNADGTAVPSNPFYSASAPKSWRSLVYAYGFRNPFRFDLDPRSGVPHLGDVGWYTTEEVDTVRAGMNGGWPCYEGAEQNTYFATDARCVALYSAGSAVPPITEYPHAGAGAAVVGGMHYTGTVYPSTYLNSFFYGDYVRHELWTLATDTNGALTRAPEAAGFATDIGGPVAFHAGPNGDVTYADLVAGNIERLVYTAGNRPPTAQFTSTTDAATRTVSFDASSSYDLDGDALTYRWDFGDGSSPATGVTARHVYGSPAQAVVTLTVRDQLGAQDSATATVYPANFTPVLNFTPPPPTTYQVGGLVKLSASATDPEDGPLPVSWFTYLLHCPFAGSCHVHPGDTVTGPNYSEPFTDHGADTVMVITVSATDSKGATASASYEADPTLRTVAVNSPVAVAINGIISASQQAVVGSQVIVNAPPSSGILTFHSWSDGGAAEHAFTMPATDVTLTARYDSPIDLKYAALGGATSVVGAATGPEYPVVGGRARDYTRGRIYWSSATGAHALYGAIFTKFGAVGGLAKSGFPTNDQVAVTGGSGQYFTKARIYWSATYGAHWINGAILTKYLAAGGPTGYGLPTMDLSATTGGYYDLFSPGRSIYWSSATGSHLVYGAILSKYQSLGTVRSCLGYPTTDEYSITNGRRNQFVHGNITYHTDTHVITYVC